MIKDDSSSQKQTGKQSKGAQQIPDAPVTISQGGKEAEPVRVQPEVQMVPSEAELPKEVEEAGVEKITEVIEIPPPDVTKHGVTASAAPHPTSDSLPQVSIPLSDTQVLFGLRSSVANAFTWLAVWCLRKLKKAHIALKVIHGRVIRVLTH